MRLMIFSGALALALGGAAVAQDHSRMNHGQGGPTPTTGSAPRGPAGPPIATPDYLMKAGQSDQFEVQSGRMAQEMGKEPAVKNFGRMMVNEHSKTTDQLMAAVKSTGMSPPPPPPLSADQQAMLAELRTKSGEDFDRTYVRQQLMAHREALQVQTGYAAHGDQPKLVTVAKATAPIVQSHITALQTMDGRMNRR